MRLRALPRPAALLPALLGLLLAIALVPVLASPAWAAPVVVTGTVTGPDASGDIVPVEDAQVEAVGADGIILDPRVYAYTAADGTYTLTLPATGPYGIEIECWGTYPCAEEYAPEPVITRSFTAASVVDASLERWGRITGTVQKNGEATAWPTGTIEASNDERQYWHAHPGVPVADDGTFTIEKVAPGTVAVTGSEPWGVENQLSTVDGQSFTVAPGDTTDIDLAVEDWPGFYVRAVDAAGGPLEGLRWNLFSRPVGGSWDDGLQMGPLTTDADGRMSRRISDKALEYTVCFYDDEPDPSRTECRLTRCLGDAPDLASATAWRHSAGQAKLKTDLTLPLPFTTAPTPTVSGTAKVGWTLTANAGTWVPEATTLTYQWLRAGVAIAGATASTYELVAEDEGEQVSVEVTGVRAGYASESETSLPTSAVAKGMFTTVPTPTVSGTAKVGSTLTANAGTWVPAATDATYQWFRSGVAISGATGATYTLVAADAGKQISVEVTGVRAGYVAEAKASAPSVAGLAAFTRAPAPKIRGKAKVRAKLRAKVGAWSPTPAATTYQWYRNKKAIKGATKPTYKLRKADRRNRIRVVVTQVRPGYATVIRKSAKTKRIR